MKKGSRAPKCRFSLEAFWFVRGLNIIRAETFPIPNLPAFRRAVRPYRNRRYVALYLNRDEFQTGGVWAHFTGLRGWLTHFDSPGGTDSYVYSTRGLARLPERLQFRLNNGQVDEVHKSFTVPRAHGMQALEYFLLHGERNPMLHWVEQPGDLWKPA